MPKQRCILAIMLCAIIWNCGGATPAAAAKPELRGNVFILGQQDERTPVVNTTVRIEETGDTDVTIEGGAFRIFLPEIFRAGDKITLQVKKEGYQILYPVGGATRVPAELAKERINIELDELGSHRFLSKAAFRLLIENMAVKAKEQVRADQEQPQEIDLSRYLRAWAVQYGFGLDQVQAELDQWAAEVAQKQEDFYELGLAAFYQKNFGEAATKFSQSDEQDAAKREQVRQQRVALNQQEQELTDRIIQSRIMQGQSYYNDYRFQEALSAYQKALTEINQTQDPQRWASVMNDLSNIYANLGTRVEGQAAQTYLAEAVAASRAALEVRTRADLPQDWAMTQNNLGNALSAQGERTSGERGMRLLAEAVAAYRAALEIFTRADLPQDWATTQNNLGTALRKQSERTAGERRTCLLADAVAAYRAALEVWTRADLPQNWAGTQNNLGVALLAQGERTSGASGRRLLAEAVAAYRAALDVYTRADLPPDWAMTQNNLGNALSAQGERTNGELGRRLLIEAVAAYRAALKVYTRADLAQNWAGTQNNLGNALKAQALRSENEERARLLNEAMISFTHALEIYAYQDFSYYWGVTQNNLAETYDALQDWKHATECYMNVLKVYPDYETAYQRASTIYQHYLFQFEDAYQLDLQWVKGSGHYDLAAVSNFITSLFNTKRFTEAETMLTLMLPKSGVTLTSYLPLHAIEIANLSALNKLNEIPAKLDTLIVAVQQQSADFTVQSSFNGIKHFIRTTDALASRRDWLLSLFSALEAPQRAAIVQQLEVVRAAWGQYSSF